MLRKTNCIRYHSIDGGVRPHWLLILAVFLLIYHESKSAPSGGQRPKCSTRHNSCLAGRTDRPALQPQCPSRKSAGAGARSLSSCYRKEAANPVDRTRNEATAGQTCPPGWGQVFRCAPGSFRHPEALKEKQRQLRGGFPMPLTLRVRVLSWLRRALAEDEDLDVRWIKISRRDSPFTELNSRPVLND